MLSTEPALQKAPVLSLSSPVNPGSRSLTVLSHPRLDPRKITGIVNQEKRFVVVDRGSADDLTAL